MRSDGVSIVECEQITQIGIVPRLEQHQQELGSLLGVLVLCWNEKLWYKPLLTNTDLLPNMVRIWVGRCKRGQP